MDFSLFLYSILAFHGHYVVHRMYSECVLLEHKIPPYTFEPYVKSANENSARKPLIYQYVFSAITQLIFPLVSSSSVQRQRLSVGTRAKSMAVHFRGA